MRRRRRAAPRTSDARLDPAACGNHRPPARDRHAGVRATLPRASRTARSRAAGRAPRSTRAARLLPSRRARAAARRTDPSAGSEKFLESSKRRQEAGARQAREHAVVGRDDRMEGAGVVARGFLRRLGVPLVEVDFPAARAQALAHRRAGEARADDGGLSSRLWTDLSGSGCCARPAFPSCRRSPGASRPRSRSPPARGAPPRRRSRWRRWRRARRGARASACSCGDHMSGFFAGAKPSR